MIRINLISGPRNISTAMMYSFAQRDDTTVVDEPFYAYYLKVKGKQHPGREEVLQSGSADLDDITNCVLFGNYDTPIVFFKQMAHHFQDFDTGLLEGMKNILLIRDPAEMVASFTKVVQDVTIDDFGVKQAHALYHQLNSADNPVIVIDAKYVLQNPEHVLKKLCKKLDIPFTGKMLHWKTGPRKEDGVWAKYWYANVHRSTGFKAYKPKPVHLAGRFNAIVEEASFYYNALFENAIN
jgi:sulfotransferase family protein